MSHSPVALVTGAATRIGRAIALRMAAEGRAVAVHYRASGEAARSLCEEIRGLGCDADAFGADLTSAEDVARLARDVLERFGRVDVLVNNASPFHPTPVLGTDPKALVDACDEFHAVHVRAPLQLIAAFAPGMRSRGEGRVVNLTDAALGTPRPEFAPYQASKAALEQLTKVLGRELAPEITVNAVAPGAILPPPGMTNQGMEGVVAQIPARRLGRVEEIADAVEFFVGGPSYVTGQILAVDGGR